MSRSAAVLGCALALMVGIQAATADQARLALIISWLTNLDKLCATPTAIPCHAELGSTQMPEIRSGSLAIKDFI